MLRSFMPWSERDVDVVSSFSTRNGSSPGWLKDSTAGVREDGALVDGVSLTCGPRGSPSRQSSKHTIGTKGQSNPRMPPQRPTMFLAKKHLSRHTILRGLGTSLALPFLDAMLPAQTSPVAPAVRLTCIEMVHGAAGCSDVGADKNLWSPAQEGENFDFSYSLQPLAPFRDSLTIISGTDARQAEAFTPTEVGADHFRSSAVFLTGARPKQTAGADFRSGTSIDQVYARHLAQQTRIQSLQLGIEHLDATNSCGFNYNCIYSDAISWGSPNTPLPPEINPRLVFERLFGAGKQRPNPSVLDSVVPDTTRLRQAIGTSDQNRLNEYLHDLRDVERRIQAIERHNTSGERRELYAAPIGVPDSWEDHVKLIFDLLALAFAADLTRVSTFKLSHDVSNRIFPKSGVNAPFHSLSHHKEAPAQIAQFAKLNRYHVSLVPYFLEKLKRTPDGEGSLLDHSVVLYGSPMGDSETHNHRRVPLFLAGSGRPIEGESASNLP